jgi:hypothetical protein
MAYLLQFECNALLLLPCQICSMADFIGSALANVVSEFEIASNFNQVLQELCGGAPQRGVSPKLDAGSAYGWSTEKRM